MFGPEADGRLDYPVDGDATDLPGPLGRGRGRKPVSKLGIVTAFSAEAALWVAGAALIAGAAGAHWNLPAVDLSAVTGSKPAASASATAVESAIPGASPNDYAALTKFLALESRPDFQFKSTVTMSETFAIGEAPTVAQVTGTYDTNGTDTSSMLTTTVLGTTSVGDTVVVGHITYKSTDGKNWTRSERLASDGNSFLPTGITFLDEGVETWHGVRLHRLAAGPPDLVNASFSQGVGSNASDATMSVTLLVDDEGVLAAVEMSGTVDVVVNEAPVKVTITATYEVTATSGVTIEAPI
jgi:hypothetical protein